MKYCRKEDDVFYHMVMTNKNTKTKTKCIEDPTYAIFSKSRQFKDITYDQTRPDQDREEFNLADLILELAFLLSQILILILFCLPASYQEIFLYLRKNQSFIRLYSLILYIQDQRIQVSSGAYTKCIRIHVVHAPLLRC